VTHPMRTGPGRQRIAAPSVAPGTPTFAAFSGTLGPNPAPTPTPTPASRPLGRIAAPDLVRLRKELGAGAVRGIVVDHPRSRECMGEMTCVERLSELLDTLPEVDHGEFVTPSRVIRFVRFADGAVAVDVVPGTDLAAALDTVMPLSVPAAGTAAGDPVVRTGGKRVREMLR